ncbi:hypothetical protein ENBRE01_1404 [Enteropsectra breve]|nr:hypothetical protein ENBRE01_1027 [Enteropsectra breve]KAI5150287.1 hypothetical protein ENBRE01_1404 [Enteropsectra breve]
MDKSQNSKEIEWYKNIIREARKDLKYLDKLAGADSKKINEDAMEYEDLLQEVEEINKMVYGKEEVRSAEKYIEYMSRTIPSFLDKKYDYLFVKELQYEDINKSSEKHLKNKKIVDYSYRNKLSGFCCKNGRPEWEDSRIDELVDQIKNSSKL